MPVYRHLPVFGLTKILPSFFNDVAFSQILSAILKCTKAHQIILSGCHSDKNISFLGGIKGNEGQRGGGSTRGQKDHPNVEFGKRQERTEDRRAGGQAVPGQVRKQGLQENGCQIRRACQRIEETGTWMSILACL